MDQHNSFIFFSTSAVVDPTQPTKNWKISIQLNPTHGSTQPMENSDLDTWRPIATAADRVATDHSQSRISQDGGLPELLLT